MTTVIKGPWPAQTDGPGLTAYKLEKAPAPDPDRQQQKKLMEEYWNKPGVGNPMHLNRPWVMRGHEQSQPKLFTEQGEIVTDGGAERNRFNNFLIKIRKENP